MRIEISESNYKAMCEITKDIPAELAAKAKKSDKGNERIVCECKYGPLMTGDAHGGDHILAIVQAANLLREISYTAQINRLQEERDGYQDPIG